MRRWKNILWVSAAILTLAYLVGSITPHAIAQVRAMLVREMDSPIRGMRFSHHFTLNFTGAHGDKNITPLVPAGKKLFLQSVSMHTTLTDSQSLLETSVTIDPNVLPGATDPIKLWVPQTFQSTATTFFKQRHFIGNRDINILLNTGETIKFSVFRNNDLGTSYNHCTFTIYGYFVDANP